MVTVTAEHCREPIPTGRSERDDARRRSARTNPFGYRLLALCSVSLLLLPRCAGALPTRQVKSFFVRLYVS